jgi:hypothetical protein
MIIAFIFCVQLLCKVIGYEDKSLKKIDFLELKFPFFKSYQYLPSPPLALAAHPSSIVWPIDDLPEDIYHPN